jgi:hypothetical protein
MPGGDADDAVDGGLELAVPPTGDQRAEQLQRVVSAVPGCRCAI